MLRRGQTLCGLLCLFDGIAAVDTLGAANAAGKRDDFRGVSTHDGRPEREEVGGGLGVAEGGVGLTLADARRLAAVGQASPHLSEHGRIRDVSLSDAVNVGGADRTSWMPRSRLGATRTAN